VLISAIFAVFFERKPLLSLMQAARKRLSCRRSLLRGQGEGASLAHIFALQDSKARAVRLSDCAVLQGPSLDLNQMRTSATVSASPPPQSQRLKLDLPARPPPKL
jgi:hypothetical protein